MNLAKKIVEIRKLSGLTQDGLAARLFVTRQAVSRWENGETTPTVDTLKRITEIFKVDANSLLGDGEPVFCQSCGMPLARIGDLGENADKSANTEYCSYCFLDGKCKDDFTIDEMVEHNLNWLKEWNEANGTSYTKEEARPLLKSFLSTLKRWKKQN